MVLGIPCYVLESTRYIQISHKSLLIFEKEGSLIDSISLESIKSLHVKNEDKFFLRITYRNNLELVLKFDSYLNRDITKSLIIFVEKEIKERKRIDVGDTDLYNELTSKYHFDEKLYSSLTGEIRGQQIKNFSLYEIESKNDLLKCFIQQPYLLHIYVEMQVTLKQFFNLLKGSYFFDDRNEKNAVDRRIQGMFGVELNFASRVNQHNRNEVEDVEEISSKPLVEKEIAFSPIYPYEENIIEEAREFIEPVLNGIKVDLKADNEPINDTCEYTKGNMINICSFIYENRNSVNKSEEIRKLAKEVEEEMLKNVGEHEKKIFGRVVPSFFLKK
ncbi:hypothetical protein VCUG_01930 [Vavraia culicis subsp. floridensis]|uniref:Uncharacterized protein n=1 Tax=Vavraia culicis (isolate floridensis) TaxID=948595 RepID=L2GU22_VAVCU|nr:uncharacterized protein VCUG_01930 [Vavraia culicis subsp. floridensis]ELA46600.1 hypothetical protein VCUG_01930 [Vavraia culicis subsp. floridensis]